MNLILKLFFMLRSVLSTMLFLISTVLISIVVITIIYLFNKKSRVDVMVKLWSNLTCWLFNVKVNVHNKENILKTGCLYLFNHSSFFDIFALAAAIPHVRFGAKIELFKIPFFGMAIKKAGTLPISRGSRDEVFKVYNQAQSRLQNNECFALAPEGGRFYGKKLSPFKAGPFVFAIDAGAAIVPVIIKGAYECLPKKNFLANTDRWKRQIDIYFLDSISVKNLTYDDRQSLQRTVYDQMNPIWENI